MSRPRVVAAILLSLLALALAALLLSLSYGLADEYGAGAGGLLVWAVLPLAAASVAVALTGFRWWALAGGVLLCVLTIVGVGWSARAGGSHRVERLAAADAEFGCNNENSEAFVPDEVDRAFRDVAHASPYWLYGPISGSPLGCTGAIQGDPAESFPAWRAALLESGWTVERDDHEVVVSADGVRLTLFVQVGLSMLNATSEEADDCTDGRATTTTDGQVGVC
jgi:hypothetical protein